MGFKGDISKDFLNDKIFRTATEILNIGYVCNRCLGRAFGKLLHGITNERRGEIVRDFIALSLEAGVKIDLRMENFQDYNFRWIQKTSSEEKKCSICDDIFLEIVPKLIDEAIKNVRRYEFRTFLVGTILNKTLYEKDELILRTSPKYGESIKDEINRDVGKRLEGKYDRTVDHEDPQLVIILDLKRLEVEIKPKSLFVYGGYKKLVRGIPQTTWHCRRCRGKGCRACGWKGKMYRTSVQQIIEKPLLKMSKGGKSSFHGAGREDVDVRCLDYRPFIIEILNPRMRNLDLQKALSEINRSKFVEVNDLRFTDKDEVASIKEAKVDKTYKVIVTFKRPLKQLDRLKVLNGAKIAQQTPLRVLSRRADILRERKVNKIEFRRLTRFKAEIFIECEAGTYVKELVSGDGGRTKPNVADVLENDVKKILLDVVKISRKE
ncbi:MAG: tRNA pseudouridine(54/55) synthase Pus10 [Nitrososphaeria archaeon]